MFVGREKELESLRLLLDKRTSSLVAFRGRRRIGKSTLIEEFARRNHCRLVAIAGNRGAEKPDACTGRLENAFSTFRERVPGRARTRSQGARCTRLGEDWRKDDVFLVDWVFTASDKNDIVCAKL